jgi:microcystin-dependent protein
MITMHNGYKTISSIFIVSMVLVFSTFLPTVLAVVTIGENSITSDDVLTLEGANSISAIGNIDVIGSILQNGHLLMPTGSMMMYAGTATPEGYLFADGSAVSRVAYADLFSVIGITYGSGNDSTTFNLPDMRDRMPIGANGNLGTTGGNSTVTLTENELPEHTHTVNDPGHTHETSGTLLTTGSNTPASLDNTPNEPDLFGTVSTQSTSNTTGITIDSTGNGEAFSILNPYVSVNYIIKF